MSQVTVQGKQRALIRVAESRVAALDAVTASKEHASRCVKSLPVSPSVLKRIGLAAGAAASVMGALAGLRKRKKTAEKRAEKSPASACVFLVQMLSPVLLPFLQRFLQKSVLNQGSSVSGKRSDF